MATSLKQMFAIYKAFCTHVFTAYEFPAKKVGGSLSTVQKEQTGFADGENQRLSVSITDVLLL